MLRLASLALVAACSFKPGVVIGNGDGAIDSPPDMRSSVGWSTPVEISELNSGVGDDDPSLTSDLLEIYFGSVRPGGQGQEDIWRAKRATPTAAWGNAENVGELNSSSNETTIKMSYDGRAIFFASTRDSPGNNHDLYYSTRDTIQDMWRTPQRILELSTNDGDYGPWPRVDLLRLILCSGSSVANEALYTSERGALTDQWGSRKRINELDESNVSECDPMEPSTDTLYFASNRSGNYDVYVARRMNGTYGPITEVAAVNVTSAHDRDPWVSPDERYMVFVSTRSGQDRLYFSTR